MEKELSFANILDDDFDFDINEQQDEDPVEKKIKENEEITEVENLDEEGLEPESVGDDENTGEKEDANGNKNQGSSPLTFSSIAEAFVEEGIFQNLEDDEVKNAKSAQDFVDLMKKEMQAQLDETQRNINDALNAGLAPDEIRQYTEAISYLNGITEDQISDESPEAENLRVKLIYNDFLNRGIPEDKAKKLTQRSIDNGTDVEDAKDALSGNIDFYKKRYSESVAEARKKSESDRAEIQRQSEELKKSIMEDEKVFGDLQIDKSTRQKIYDNISKPVFKDKETGDLYTAIQKYEKEHPTEFRKFVGMYFTLTDGFTKLGDALDGKVKKEVGNGMKRLERVINGTARTSTGKLDFLSGIHDPETSSRKINLDI